MLTAKNRALNQKLKDKKKIEVNLKVKIQNLKDENENLKK